MSDMEAEIERKRQEIANKLVCLGKRIEAGDEDELLVWVIPESLACAHRPLRHNPLYGGSGQNLAPDAAEFMVEWANRVRQEGIKGILCLMHDRDLGYYKCLSLGSGDLLGFYAERGFSVAHLPWEDPHHKRTSALEKRKKELEIRPQALRAFDDLPKPVIVHCSAGVDRSSPVAAYLWYCRGRPPAAWISAER